MFQDGVNNAGAVEPGDHAEPTRDCGRFECPGLAQLTQVQLDVDPAGGQWVQPDLGAPVEEHPQVAIDVAARQAGVIEVAAEPATYIHAKWVHLRGRTGEALLTGSANLSRSALLRPAADGNVEDGVITTAASGGFASLYDPLRRTPIDNLATLGLSIQPTETPPTTSDQPVVLWSRLDRNKLTVVFDRPVGSLPVASGSLMNS